MLAVADLITILFGSIGGIAALVIAINTVLMRREANKQKSIDTENTNRMDTFETSQFSLQAALLRADTENERLRVRMSAQDTEISTLRAEVAVLTSRVEELSRAK